MRKPSFTKDEIISLDEYSKFQYMLARPSTAKATVNQITSFVFYNEPHDEQKKDIDHQVLVQGIITVVNYYCCCLVLLPSHILGMSRWISAEDYCQSSSTEDDDQKASKQTKIHPGETLRRFRYSYYWGMLQVDTHHVLVGYANNGKDKKFRLIEYMTCPISPWVIVHAVFALLASFVLRCLQRCGSFVEMQFLPCIVLVLVLLHSILFLTGVQMW